MGATPSKACMDTWNTGARTSDFSANGGSVEFSLAYSINKAVCCPATDTEYGDDYRMEIYLYADQSQRDFVGSCQGTDLCADINGRLKCTRQANTLNLDSSLDYSRFQYPARTDKLSGPPISYSRLSLTEACLDSITFERQYAGIVDSLDQDTFRVVAVINIDKTICNVPPNDEIVYLALVPDDLAGQEYATLCGIRSLATAFDQNILVCQHPTRFPNIGNKFLVNRGNYHFEITGTFAGANGVVTSKAINAPSFELVQYTRPNCFVMFSIETIANIKRTLTTYSFTTDVFWDSSQCTQDDPLFNGPYTLQLARIDPDGGPDVPVTTCTPAFNAEVALNQFRLKTVSCSWAQAREDNADAIYSLTLRSAGGKTRYLGQAFMIPLEALPADGPPLPSLDPTMKRKRENARNYQLAMSGVDFHHNPSNDEPCPRGHIACPEGRDRWSCTDVMILADSCGACPFSPAAVDCWDIPHVESVACHAGACQVLDCEADYRVANNGSLCERLE